MEVSESLNQIAAPIALFAWTLVYILMTKRGLQDRTFAMPIVALALDIGVELYFTIYGSAQVRGVFGPWFVLNLGVLYTVVRFGRAEFDWPLLQRWFGVALLALLSAGYFLVFSFIRAFEDVNGALVASLCMLVYSTLLPVMAIRRNSVRGQSLYIALLILIGDLAGFVTTLYAQNHGTTVTPMGWFWAVNAVVIPLHVFYVVLVWWLCRRDGINPWRRL